MLLKIFKSIFKNFQTFLITWIIVILINQLSIFGACFAPYCLLAALPHTGIISALLIYFFSNEKQIQDNIESFQEQKSDNKEQTQNCSKCGSPMILKKIKEGGLKGKVFWSCSNYPKCNGTPIHPLK